MSQAAHVRTLLFPGACCAGALVAWTETAPRTVHMQLQGLQRGGYVARVAPAVYALTAKGRAKVLSEVLRCEICDTTPTVGVVVFTSSDPVTTRVVCAADLARFAPPAERPPSSSRLP